MSVPGEFSAGEQVRLRHDPGRQGVLTGKVREQAGTRKYQVGFPDGKSYHPEFELELVGEDHSDGYELLEQGRFGRVADLRRNLSHIQLSGRLANFVYSMDTTNTEFLAYQFKPVLSFLESPSNGLLIADEVGLGKTIEAGLIWTELRARYDARRLVVLCPAMLREKWVEELKERFAVEAQIMNARELRTELGRRKAEIPDGHGIVCSLQGLRPPSGMDGDGAGSRNPRRELADLLEENADEDPLIDLLIIDEAHYLRNPESRTARLGQLLRGVSDNIVLLSATPINLREDDLFYLLNIVDPDSFDVREVFPQVLAANEPLHRARELVLDPTCGREEIREALLEAKEHSLLTQNRQLAALIDGEIGTADLEDRAERVRLANGIEKINLLRHAVTRTRKADVTEWRVVRVPKTQFIEMDDLGLERELYEAVTDAVRGYAIRSEISEGFLLATPQRQLSSCMYAAVRAWQRRAADALAEQVYEDLGAQPDNDDEDAVAPLVDHISRTVASTVDLDALRRHDSKYQAFRSSLLEYLEEHKDEKVVVFSYFRGTLEYLHERLSEDGIASRVLVGGMRESKHDLIASFRDTPSERVLLSSEVASEGVDLQFCRVLVNYDLPWNPMKVEQRIGRIDRIGQEAETISIWNLLYADTIDYRIYQRLFKRLDIFRRALGGTEAVLGEKIAELTADLLRNRLTPEQEADRIEQTAMAIVERRRAEDELEEQASQLIAHSGYIMEQVHAAHDFKKRITEGDLIAYVKDYLDRHAEGHQFKQLSQDSDLYEVKLPPRLAASLEEYVQRKKLYGQTRLGTGTACVCRFLNKVRGPRETTEYINQFHPLIRFISEELQSRDEASYPLVAAQLDRADAGEVEPGDYAFYIARWTFEGLRVEEDLRVRVKPVVGGGVLSPDNSWDLLNRTKLAGTDWLSVANEVSMREWSSALSECERQLDTDYDRVRRARENENKDRVEFQIQSATKHKDRQIESLSTVLDRHQQRGRTGLVRATEGKIRRVKERFEVQTERLNNGARLASSRADVCMGVIRVR